MADRRENDAYYTPDDVAQKCVNAIRHRIPAVCRIVEPSAGGGAFLRALGQRDTYAIDIDPNAEGLALGRYSHVGDFLSVQRPDYSRPVWVIGNPPYRQAIEHVEHALSLALPDDKPAGGVALLLRLAFLESESRAAFWRRWPATEVHILTRRPSFTGGKTDSCAYAFFVWYAGDRQPVGWI